MVGGVVYVEIVSRSLPSLALAKPPVEQPFNENFGYSTNQTLTHDSLKTTY